MKRILSLVNSILWFALSVSSMLKGDYMIGVNMAGFAITFSILSMGEG